MMMDWFKYLLQEDSMWENSDEELEFVHQVQNQQDQSNRPQSQQNDIFLLSKKEQDRMLYSIKIHDSENLLDLNFEPDSEVEKALGYRVFVEDRIASVSSPVTINEGYIVSYKLYKINTRKTNSQKFDTTADRRFSDFEYLHAALIQKNGGLIIPRLPQKNIWASFDLETLEYQNFRRKSLQKYLNKLLRHPKLRYSDQLRWFLFEGDGKFSEMKGGYTSQKRVEDQLSKIYSYGTHLASKYLHSGSSPSRTRVTLLKQENQIAHNQVIVRNLSSNLLEIKTILNNTIQEHQNYRKLCELSEKIGEIAQESAGNQEQEEILSSYEDLVEFVESCTQALQRWNNLKRELEELKQHQKTLSPKSLTHPRNKQLDIVHSKIHTIEVNLSEWTKVLLTELEQHIHLGKSMLSQFIQQLSQFKARTYLCVDYPQ